MPHGTLRPRRDRQWPGRRIKSGLLLWANGRSCNTDTLNLTMAGLEAGQRDQLLGIEHFQTRVPSIYAVGDIAGPPALASAGYVQGYHAARHIIDQGVAPHRFDMVPNTIYTLPEISSLGAIEAELLEKNVPYKSAIGRHRRKAEEQAPAEPADRSSRPPFTAPDADCSRQQHERPP